MFGSLIHKNSNKTVGSLNCMEIGNLFEMFLPQAAKINQIIFVWLLTSLIGHNHHRGAGPGSLGVNNLEGNQILGVGRQPGYHVSEIQNVSRKSIFR